MPPPINQSGSKAALVTWTVITSILFVVATVLAIFAQVDRNKLEAELETTRSGFNKVVSDTDLNGQLVQNLQAVQSNNPAYKDSKLLNIAVTQRQNLAKAIAGDNVAGEADALTAAQNAMNQAKEVGVNPPAPNLVATVTAATAELKNRQQQIKSLEAARNDLTKQVEQINKNIKQQLDAKDADIAAARAQVAAFQGDVQTYSAEKDKQIQQLQSQADQQLEAARADANRLQAQIQELNGKLKQQQQALDATRNRLRGLRLPVDQIVRQADAHVIRIAGDGIVYIDIGSGDQATTGMSFEVFDRLEGVPKAGEPTNDDNLPKGKASIEIIRTTPGSSECRVVRQTPGAQIVEGDICVNVVYDRNAKYNFYVYGNFDLDRNGQATPQDADIVKRLITSWGGRVADQLNVDTDFLVVGKVPEIPNYTAEELDDPAKVYEVEQKKKELQEYDEIISKAIELNIPVLNQNRFLYFTGYYEQSAR